ncbi:MAG: TonB-dependent receptor [Haliea sp.]|nr:TonB-dependent receptor [Haliea sp.]
MHSSAPLTAVLGLTICATGALADMRMLEEVVVTATKQAASLQDIAVTVTAFSEQAIREAGIRSAEDVAVLTPSLNINANISPFSTRMSIRGIGTAGSTYLEPSVGVFVDGVYLNRSGLSVSDLVDIERIEVLQGPQGTLYGKNTNAGAISITTKAPNTEQREAHLEASAGNYAMQRLNGSVSAPLSDTLAYRLAGNYHQRDGYLENFAGPDLNDADEWNAVGKLLWEPTANASVLFKASRVERDMNCCSPDTLQNPIVEAAMAERGQRLPPNDPFDQKTAQNIPSNFELESTAASLQVEYDTEWGLVESLTSWDDYDVQATQEGSRSVLDIVFLNQPQSGDSFSQELRFSGSSAALDYMAGVYYFQQQTRDGDGDVSTIVGADAVPVGSQVFGPQLGLIAAQGDASFVRNVFETKTLAVFTRASWRLSDRWQLTGGLRWSEEDKDADLEVEVESSALTAQPPESLPPFVLTQLAALGIRPPFSFTSSVRPEIDQAFNRSSDNVDWLASLSYDLSPDTLLFASASTGTKSGGFNGVAGTPEEREFDDENTLSYEVGIKATLLDSRLRINSTLFLTEIEKFQTAQQTGQGLGQITTNQGEVEVFGLELQVDALPLPNLTLGFGLQYLDTYEFTAGPDQGQNMPFAAELSGNVSATLAFPLTWGGVYLRGDYSFMSDHLTNVASGAELEAKDTQDRNTLNIALGWRDDNWSVSL